MNAIFISSFKLENKKKFFFIFIRICKEKRNEFNFSSSMKETFFFLQLFVLLKYISAFLTLKKKKIIKNNNIAFYFLRVYALYCKVLYMLKFYFLLKIGLCYMLGSGVDGVVY